jgi:hypothetical protein
MSPELLDLLRRNYARPLSHLQHSAVSPKVLSELRSFIRSNPQAAKLGAVCFLPEFGLTTPVYETIYREKGSTLVEIAIGLQHNRSKLVAEMSNLLERFGELAYFRGDQFLAMM